MEGLKQDIENIIYRRLAPIIGDTNTKVTDEAAADVYEYLVKKLNQDENSGSLFESLNSSIQNCVNIFCSKHELELDFWVADLVGTVGCFSNEYYIDFETIRLDLEKDIPKDVFFTWFDLTLDLEMKDEPIVNYYSYLKGVRKI